MEKYFFVYLKIKLKLLVYNACFSFVLLSISIKYQKIKTLYIALTQMNGGIL